MKISGFLIRKAKGRNGESREAILPDTKNGICLK
jgi:hypothetical protein